MQRWLVPLMMLCAAVSGVSHAGWLEELNPFQPTEVVPLAQGGQDGDVPNGILPFTTLTTEKRAITDNLPCKWLSVGGGQGEARYDFLCKGGTWATVSLMLDQSPRDADGIGRVRLIFREWPETVHPGGGEAYVAQQFLQFVTAHFVPANLAKEVEAAFWYRRDRNWRISRVMEIGYSYQDEGKFVLRRLEIRGRGKAVKLPGQAGPSPAVTPTEAGLGRAETPVQAPTPKPQPQPLPKAEPVAETPQAETPPVSEKALQPATQADIGNQPEPSSLVKPLPPVISNTLVPSADERINNRPKAPTNFDAYNKAEELTKDYEKKATSEGMADKVKPAQPVSATLPPADAPLAEPVPHNAEDTPAAPVQAMPTPAMEGEVAEPLETPKEGETWPQGEGLGDPSTPPPSVESEARFTPTRSLPQLKFIPKAVPLQRPDEVIQFEDEGSGL